MTQATLLSAEFRFLVWCCAWPSGATGPGDLELSALDWPRVIRLIDRHRVAGLAHQALRSLPAGQVPAAVAATIARRATRVAHRNLLHAGEALRLDRAAVASGVDLAFLKGATLAMLTHGSLTLRHAKDIDLLVPPEQVAAAARLLEAEGYRRTLPAPSVGADRLDRWLRWAKNLAYRHPDQGIEVELHWRLFDNLYLAVATPTPDRWIAVTITADTALKTLAPDDLLTYLLGHGAFHGWFRLKWLADLQALLAGCSPDRIEAALAHAERAGLGRAATQGLSLVAQLWPRAVPVRSSGGLAQRYLLATAARCLADEAEPARRAFAPTRIRLTHFVLGTGWRYRWAILNSAEDWPTLPLPGRLAWLYPWLKGPFWLLRLVRRGVSPARGDGRTTPAA